MPEINCSCCWDAEQPRKKHTNHRRLKECFVMASSQACIVLRRSLINTAIRRAGVVSDPSAVTLPAVD